MVKVDCQTESKTVSVVAVDVPKPPFACKPIVAVLAKGEL
jgi:hypothetical protein